MHWLRLHRHDMILAGAAMTTLIAWSSAFIAISVAVRGFSPGALTLGRSSIAALILAISVWYRTRRSNRESDHPMRPADHLALFLSGAIGITAYQIILSYGEQFVEAGTASLLVNTSPLFATLASSIWLDERLSARGWLAIALGFTGATLVAFGRGDVLLSRQALVILAAALAQGIYFVIQKPLLGRFGALRVTAHAVWWGALLALPFAGSLVHSAALAPLSSVLAVLYLGVVPSALAYFTWGYVLSQMSTSRAATLLFLVPPNALVIARVVLGETPSLLAVAGGALTIVGVGLVATSRKQTPASSPSSVTPRPSTTA